jgi:hypothetical protein
MPRRPLMMLLGLAGCLGVTASLLAALEPAPLEPATAAGEVVVAETT